MLTPYIRSLAFTAALATSFNATALAQQNNEDLNATFEKARSLRLEHKYEKSLKVYDSIISKHPENARAHQEKGAVLASLNRYRDAIAEENKALKINPKLHLAHIYKGMIFCNKGRNLDAYSEFKNALELKPKSFVVHMRLGFVCSRLKRNKEALTWYQKATKIIENRSAPHLALSAVHIRMGAIDKAIDEAKIAIELEPSAINYSNLGEIYSIINRLPEARENLDRALKLDPSLVTSWVTLGRVFTLMGDYKQAQEAYIKARELSRRNKEAFTALDMLKDKSIHRVVVVDSSTDWKESEKGGRGHAPRVKVKLKNVSGMDLSGKTLYFRAVFENLSSGSKARARGRVKEDFPEGKTVEVELASRKYMSLPQGPDNWPFVQCTVNCRVGDVSSWQSQYILDRLMEKTIKIKAEDPDRSANL